jgi:hypothetical protein
MILSNPYPDKESSHRVQADIPEAVFQQLLRTFPGHGNVQAIINTLIFDLIEDLNHANIKYYELDRESFILSFLRRSSASGAASRGSARTDAGRSGDPDSNPPKRKSQRIRPDSSNRKGDKEKVTTRQKGKAARPASKPS